MEYHWKVRLVPDLSACLQNLGTLIELREVNIILKALNYKDLFVVTESNYQHGECDMKDFQRLYVISSLAAIVGSYEYST